MKKNRPPFLLFLVALILFSFTPFIAFSQQSYLSINTGPSFFMGANGSDNTGYGIYDVPVRNVNSFQATLDGAYFFDPNNGIYGVVGFSNQFYNTVGLTYTYDSSGQPVEHNGAMLSRSQNAFFFIGPIIGFGDKRFSFKLKAAVGIYYIITDTIYNTPYDLGVSQQHIATFGSLVGASVHYKCNPNISIVLKCDMVFNNLSFYPTNISPAFGIAYNFRKAKME